MPVYNLTNMDDKLALCREQPDSARRHAIAEIIRKRYGEKAKTELLNAWESRRRKAA